VIVEAHITEDGSVRQNLPGKLSTTSTIVAVVLLATVGAFGATGKEARDFVDEAEARLLDLWIEAGRASWVKANFITQDTEALEAAAMEKLMAATADIATDSTRFDGLELPADLRRKILLIKTSLPTVAPRDPDKQAEQARITSAMEGVYGKGKYCSEARDGECLDLTAMTRILAESRDAGELLDLWVGWRTISPPMREMYERFVELNNEGAKELGFADLGELWRSGYDMSPAAFAGEVDRLWGQVKPLYDALHCHVRARLAETYGSEVVPGDAPIPAHLLGNMWSQSWGNVYDLVGPGESDTGYDVTELLEAKGLDAQEMVRYGERFFTSLGFEPLPETFWERSLFTKPADREVVCHASAWDLDYIDDLRIKMCIDITEEDFTTIHHELGHNFYQRAYAGQSPLHRNSANDGFHEGIGDTVALSVTPEYLVTIGLLDEAPDTEGDLGLLMRMALDKVAFLPFGLLVDQYRWKVFSGEIRPDEYNAAWWKLRTKYQGIRPPVERTEADFDPGAKYHIPANVPYTRYFLAHILQFQFHRALCEAAGSDGPLHRCSIYGNGEAGRRLIEMLEMGMSSPWPEALEAITGQREMDATAILDYFAPLKRWLDEENRERTCGW
jgi:peptidyl-dipeptidase A